jgi:TusA-related sulfurtransferase
MTMWRFMMVVPGRWKFASVVSMSFMAALVLSIPVLASEKENLEWLIERTNTKRSTPERVSEFVSKLMDYYYIENPVVEGLLKEFKPGEVMTIIAIADLSKKDIHDIAKMRNEGMEWQEIAGKSGITMGLLIKDIQMFQRASG